MTDRRTDRQTDTRHTDSAATHCDRQTDIQTQLPPAVTDRQTDIQTQLPPGVTDRQTDRH